MSNDAHNPATLISYMGSTRNGRCGYCTKSTSCSFYLRSYDLTVTDYQTLLDRGWRRSGTLLYKPHMTLSCCPQYTIRVDATTIKTSRDQRQTLHKWSRYILGEGYIQECAKKYPKSKEEKRRQQSEFNLIETVHGPEYSTLQGLNRIPPEPAHKFEVELESTVFTEEKYELYENYQRTVHQEPAWQITRSGFVNFLCRSPIMSTTTPSGMRLGSYHQCYRVDGRLVAMGVLDLLPHCVSGVYFMYHGDYRAWGFGKLSACREAALAREGGYQYYYMGFYIHSCPKMWYKREYGPCHLLDPETYAWNLFDKNLERLLDRHGYVGASTIRSHGATGGDGIPEKAPGSAPSGDMTEAGGRDESEEEDEEEVPLGFVFSTKMPGIMTKQEIEDFDVRTLKFQLGGSKITTKELEELDLATYIDVGTEVLATVGPDVAKSMVLSIV
ncbi:arginine-tRNA-protein transferase [Tuber indicum]|nr:arginine-tRNA-protein transferase [Tuber indicum]